MNILESSLITNTLVITFILLVISFLLALFRLIKGPSIPDRVVTIDLITTIFMGVIILFLLIHNQSVFLDVIGALAVIAFLGTIASARYLEKGGPHD